MKVKKSQNYQSRNKAVNGQCARVFSQPKFESPIMTTFRATTPPTDSMRLIAESREPPVATASSTTTTLSPWNISRNIGISSSASDGWSILITLFQRTILYFQNILSKQNYPQTKHQKRFYFLIAKSYCAIMQRISNRFDCTRQLVLLTNQNNRQTKFIRNSTSQNETTWFKANNCLDI